MGKRNKHSKLPTMEGITQEGVEVVEVEAEAEEEARGRQSYDKSTIRCYNCQSLGHFQYECPEWEKKANYVEFDDSEEILLMAYGGIN